MDFDPCTSPNRSSAPCAALTIFLTSPSSHTSSSCHNTSPQLVRHTSQWLHTLTVHSRRLCVALLSMLLVCLQRGLSESRPAASSNFSAVFKVMSLTLGISALSSCRHTHSYSVTSASISSPLTHADTLTLAMAS